MQYGKNITDKKNEGKGIEALTAKRIILAEQTALEIQRAGGIGLLTGTKREYEDGIYNLSIGIEAIQNLIPGAIQTIKTGDEERKTFRRVVVNNVILLTI
jgi:molybdopterin synthase catalytic subunit